MQCNLLNICLLQKSFCSSGDRKRESANVFLFRLGQKEAYVTVAALLIGHLDLLVCENGFCAHRAPFFGHRCVKQAVLLTAVGFSAIGV